MGTPTCCASASTVVRANSASHMFIALPAGRLDQRTGFASGGFIMSATQLSTAEATLIRAISARRVVAGRYAGSRDAGIRVFYPHVLFRSAAGELLIDVFQVVGPSRGGHLPGWRTLKVAGLRELEILEAVFIPVPRLDLVSTGYRRQIVAQCGELRLVEPDDEDDDLP